MGWYKMSYTLKGNYDGMGITPSNEDAVKIKSATSKVEELLSVQKKVDTGLSKMKAGPDKTRLMRLREENRGYFTSYILPIYQRIKNYLSSSMGNDEAMGLLPLIPFAIAAAATASVGYVAKNVYSEYKILNDPAFTAAQKTEILGGGGLKALSNLAGSAKTVVIVGVLGFAAYYLAKNSGAIRGGITRLRS